MSVLASGETVATADTSRPAQHFAYQAPLDGMRAIAVIAVLLFHHYQFDPNKRAGWSGGFLGVDVFFVLSGFLITSLLLVEHRREGRVSLRAFWTRRARRLLPALFVMLVFVAVLAAWVFPARDLAALRADAFSALFYVENWHRLHAPTTAVNHTWSLSVEEQWYLIWPIALAALLAFTRRRLQKLVLMIGVLIGVSVVAMAALYTSGPIDRAYYGTDTRAQSLLVGAGLAAVLLLWRGPQTRQERFALEAAAVVGAAFVGWMFVAVHSSTADLFHGGFLLVALAVALVITAAVQPDTLVVRRVLSWRPLVAIGIISYGVYLFHWPVYMWLAPWRVHVSSSTLLALRLGVTFALAIASYFLIERPVRRSHFAPRQIVAGCVAGAMLTAVLLVVATSRPVPSNDRLHTASTLAYSHVAQLAPSGSTRVLVAGGTSALLLAVRGGGTFDGNGVFGAAYGGLGCNIAGGAPLVNGRAIPPDKKCAAWPSNFSAVADAFDPSVVVLMADSSEALDRVVNGRTLRAPSEQFAGELTRQLDRAQHALTANSHARFVLLTPFCDPTSDAATRARARWLRGVWHQYAAAHRSTVTEADVAGFLCPNGHIRTVRGQPALDAGGLTKAGALATWRWLAREVHDENAASAG
jgi:peptidoglycan/LPS O-acetylase OafA/YrhL